MKEFIKVAKQKGFTGNCPKSKKGNIDPLDFYVYMCRLQKWLRENYNLHPYIVPYGDGKKWHVPNIRHNNEDWNEVNIPYQLNQRKFPDHFDSYEDALQWGLRSSLKLIPEK